MKNKNLYLALTAIVVSAAIAFRFFTADWQEEYFANVVKDHFAAVVGLPAIAICSFILVTVLEQSAGPVKFKGLGFEFDGSSGQIAMWLACFMGMAAALKMLW